MYNVRDLLCLSSVLRIGPQKIRALVAHFRDPAAVLAATPRELVKVQGIERKLASNIVHNKDGGKFADEQLKRVNKIGARIITLWDAEYPELLKRIYDPPILLFVQGKFAPADNHSLAIVGTRHPTPYGMHVAETLARDCAGLGITVISGLARGVDTFAHEEAVRVKGRTIAVIGSGLDVPYPPENRKLSATISQRGAVVSEFPMGSKPDATNFPRRNRIISGLSLGTIVVESGEDGGAMITASTALDQDREVFAIPGNITERKSSGTNKLIREGRAKLVQNIQDVLEELRPELKNLARRGQVHTPPIELTLFEKKIFDALSSEPVHIDELAVNAATSTTDALVNLLSLEFKGLVRQMPGKMFLRV